MRRTRAVVGLALAAGVLLACEGRIDPGPGAKTNPTKNPTDPMDPADPRDPTDPTDPSNPTDPTDPTDPVDPMCEPSSVTLHRLNRAEYNNTVRDLTGLDLSPADDFPADDYGYGFDNIADVLSVSPLLVEKLDAAAEAIVDELLYLPLAEPQVATFEAEDVGSAVGAANGEGWLLWSNGELSAVTTLPAAGAYVFRVRAWAQQAGDETARMEVRADGQVLATFDVTAVNGAWQVYELSAERPAGATTLAVAFVNDFYDQAAGADRNLYVDWFEVEGPTDATGEVPAARQRVMICDPAAVGEETCARQIFAAFGARAWRRPLIPEELDRLVGFLGVAAAEGDGFEQGVRLGLQALLLSPHFLYRVELDDDVAPGEVRALDAYELASRLSYFLWSSMPDDELFARAADGTLLDPEVIEAQVRRMIADEKAQALVENFAGQWLFTRGVDDAFPDPVIFPMFDDELRAAMRQETGLVFQELLQGDRSFLDFLDADFTYVNERLAAHYGIEGVTGAEMRRVDLSGHPERGGFLTHGSFLTMTSHPTRTSPVKRGKLVLEQLLCIAPPPPPPGVEGLEEEVDPTASLRERFEQHRADPACASCHQLMDPIGFALEHFDGVGAWRETDSGFDIDASGLYMGSTPFDGHAELATLIKGDPMFPDCMTRKTLTYALGRGLVADDNCAVSNLVEELEEADYRLADLFVAIAKSEPFRMRRREGGGQ